jgi:predicted alpha/beta superfamily hydrolase
MRETVKKTMLAIFIPLAAGLAGIGGWTLSTTQRSRAAADDYVKWAQNQKMVTVKFDITAPPETPVDQTLYLSGDASEMGSWDGAGVPLHRDDDGHYRGSVDLLSGIPHKFKVTRGTWGSVERGAGGVEIPDHDFLGATDTVVQSTVLTWVDGGKSIPGKVTLTGLFRLHKKFESKILGNSRTIIVYLPPGYEKETDQRYPVLYMQDGQNLFDASTAFAGVEWQLDESAQNLISEKKIQPVIIVGIYNTPDRTAEFTPFAKTPNGADGRGPLYGRFVVEEVKPMIDKTYRTLPDRANTSVGGSSQGGMIALATAHDHPDVFSGVVTLDPWLRDSQNSLFDLWRDDAWLKGMRFYIDMGTAGGPEYPGTTEMQDLDQLTQLFDSAGLKKGTDYLATTIDGAEHNEAAWQKRVPDFLMFLYGVK